MLQKRSCTEGRVACNVPLISPNLNGFLQSQRKGRGNAVRKRERNIAALCRPCPFGIDQLFTFFIALLALQDSVSKNTMQTKPG